MCIAWSGFNFLTFDGDVAMRNTMQGFYIRYEENDSWSLMISDTRASAFDVGGQ